MEYFLEHLFGDDVTPERRIAVFTTPSRRTRLFADYRQLEQYAVQQSATQNVYFGVGLVQGEPRGRGKLRDIAAIGALWCDIDIRSPCHPKEALPGSVAEAQSLLPAMPLPPSIVVLSGHGLHAYWLLQEPWVFESDIERREAAALAKGWHGKVCQWAAERGWALENLGDLTRVLRLPRTINRSVPSEPVEVQIIEFHVQRRYAAEDFEPYLDPPETLTEAEPLSSEPLVLRPDAEPPAVKLLDLASTSPAFWETWNRRRSDLADGSQSGFDLSLATIAALCGWTDQEIADLIIAHRRHHGQKPEKALREDYVRRTIGKARRAALANQAPPVDLSRMFPPCADEETEEADRPPDDPGLLPEEMYRIPGFVSEVIDLCLETAPYPNQPMTFCGALALQAFLAGRKVRDPGDNRTNIYVLGLAYSSVGKDWIRKLNAKILHELGLASCLGNRLASGEGIQDQLQLHPNMLFQTDEIDGILQSINKAKDARHEGIMNTLLSLYSSANSVFAMRPKAGRPDPGAIDQPNLVLFGSAIPNHYYEALSERMLTNGFFARQLIVEAGKRQEGKEPGLIVVSDRVRAIARWWAEFRPGDGNLEDRHPRPAVVEHTAEARQMLAETRREADAQYAEAEERGDPVGTTVWGRASEHVRKLSLLYAVSEDHLAPRIDQPAVEWASRFVMHQTRRMLFQAAQHVADSPFHAECLRLMQKLRAAGGQLSHSVLLKRMKVDARHFRDLVATLQERGDILSELVTTAGRTGFAYRVKEG